MKDFADAVQEEAGGIVVAVGVVPSQSSLDSLGPRIQEAVGDLDLTATVSMDTGTLTDSLAQVSAAENDAATGAATLQAQATTASDAIEETGSAAQDAASATGSLASQYAALQDQLAAAGSQLDLVTGDVGNATQGMTGLSDANDAMVSKIANLNTQFAIVNDDLDAFGSQLTAAGGDMSGAADQLGVLSGAVSEVGGAVAAARDSLADWGPTVASSVTMIGTAADGSQQAVYDLGAPWMRGDVLRRRQAVVRSQNAHNLGLEVARGDESPGAHGHPARRPRGRPVAGRRLPGVPLLDR